MIGVGTVALDRPLCANCTALADDRGGRPYIGLWIPGVVAYWHCLCSATRNY